jgi:hypothetical protein
MANDHTGAQAQVYVFVRPDPDRCVTALRSPLPAPRSPFTVHVIVVVHTFMLVHLAILGQIVGISTAVYGSTPRFEGTV